MWSWGRMGGGHGLPRARPRAPTLPGRPRPPPAPELHHALPQLDSSASAWPRKQPHAISSLLQLAQTNFRGDSFQRPPRDRWACGETSRRSACARPPRPLPRPGTRPAPSPARCPRVLQLQLQPRAEATALTLLNLERLQLLLKPSHVVPASGSELFLCGERSAERLAGLTPQPLLLWASPQAAGLERVHLTPGMPRGMRRRPREETPTPRSPCWKYWSVNPL